MSFFFMYLKKRQNLLFLVIKDKMTNFIILGIRSCDEYSLLKMIQLVIVT